MPSEQVSNMSATFVLTNVADMLLVQMAFSGENSYLGLISKMYNMWFWRTVNTHCTW